MEARSLTDNRHTGPQGEAGFDSHRPMKTTVEKHKNTTETHINGRITYL